MRSSFILFTKYHWSDQIKEDEKGGGCIDEMRNAYKFFMKICKLIDHLEYVSIDGSIILKLILRK
jgi:hypothetical protein